MPRPDSTFYPPTGLYFKVSFAGILGVLESNFTEVSGISVAITPEEVKEGGENRFTHRLPSPPKYGNLVLKRGMVIGSPLISWAEACINDFQIKPKTVVVQLLNDDGKPISHWTFYNAYAVKMDFSGLVAKEAQVVIETLELSYDFFEKTL
ncbi:phage tail protein [Chitinophaga sp.]|uniref:phage tail protein n=1 Tax=Chitinophaga sp. TaxID=1869181 RepID=UPI0031DAD056